MAMKSAIRLQQYLLQLGKWHSNIISVSRSQSSQYRNNYSYFSSWTLNKSHNSLFVRPSETEILNLKQTSDSSFCSFDNIGYGSLPWLHVHTSRILKCDLHTKKYHTSVKVLAGHSHFANIKETKGKVDAERQVKSMAFMRRLADAVRAGKSADPKKNTQLDKLIKEGKKKGITLAAIEKALKREGARLSAGGGDETFVEFKGPGGIMLMIVATDQGNEVKNHINKTMKKYPGFTKGNVKSNFEQIGYISVIFEKKKSIDMEKYLDIAIEAGAEDVELIKDEEENQILNFICDPSAMSQVQQNIESQDIQVDSAESIFKPQASVQLDTDQMSNISKMIETLQESDDIVDVIHNVVEES